MQERSRWAPFFFGVAGLFCMAHVNEHVAVGRGRVLALRRLVARRLSFLVVAAGVAAG